MLEDLLQNKKSLFETGVHTELRAQENRNRWVSILQGNMTANMRSEVSGVSARVCKNGVYGFSCSAEYTDAKIEAVLRAATENALFMDKRVSKGKEMFPPITPGYVTLNKVIVDAEQKRIIDFCKEVDAYIAKKYPNLSSRWLGYTEDSMDKILYTSDGNDGHTTSPRCYIYMTMCVETREGVPVELFKAIGGAGSFDDNFSDVDKVYHEIDKLYEAVMEKKEGVYAEAGYKTVILGGMI